MEIARYSDQLEVSSARPVRVSSPALIPLATIPGDIGIIGDLYQSAQDVLQHVTMYKPMHISVNQQRTLKRASQLLFLWGEAHGASDGALDWKLQKSPRLLHLVVKILRSLLRCIVLGVMGTESTAQSRTVWRLLDRARHVKLDKEYTSPESSEDETGSEASEDEQQHDPRSFTSDVDETMGQIMETIECLQDLEASITTPALDVKDELIKSSLPQAEPIALHESFSSMIRETFPNADYLLVGDLGKANLRRFRAMLGLRTTEELQPRADVAQIAASDTKSRPQSSNHDSGYGSKETASHQSMQIAPTESAYASSVASSLSEGARSKYPPLPDEAKQGSSFECAACARQIKVQSKRQYRDHLKQDLQPYTCIINTCNAPQKHFVSRALWIDHMNEHLDANNALWASACPLCAVAMPGERYNLLAHVGKHLEEIALAVIPRDADGDEDDSVSERTDIEDDAVNVMSTTKLSALSPPTITIEAAPASSQTQFEAVPSVPRSRAKERPFGFGALERDHSEGIAAGAQSDDDAKTETAAKRTQKHPATFQCTLCPKRFTRAYNLRAHLRTHTDDRPYVCNVCGKAFARQHDRKRHEGLHSGEKKFICAGELKDGNKWGCGRRFARADALGRHFKSEAGRVCIKPIFREEAIDESPEQLEIQSLPQALLDQYPALRDIDWSAWSLPPGDEDEGYLGDTSATRPGDGDDYTSDGRIYPGIHMQVARMASPDYAQNNRLRDAPQMDANNDLLQGLADRERRKLLQQEEIFERMEREDMQRTKRRPHRSAPSRMQTTGPFSAQPHDQTGRSGSGRERSNAFIDTSVNATRVSVQNPPCNTLDVGNLSFGTSEADLKTLFSMQPGYRRLCFRTKQNGPMCFVEFESVGFAAKALRELQGHILYNNVNGGITLGYSKNSLGVRSGEPSEGSEFGFNPLMYDSTAQLGQQPFNSGTPQAQFPYAPDSTFDPIAEGFDLGLNTAEAMGKQPAADVASDAWNRLANDTYPVLDENLLATEDGILTKIPSPMHSTESISDEPGQGIVDSDSGKVSPHRSMVDEFLQRAQDARAQSSTSDDIRKGADPFRPGSLLKPYPAAAPQLTPTGRLKRSKAQGSEKPRTIEPKDALVDYVLSREEGRMPPIQQVDGLQGLGDWTHEEVEAIEEHNRK